MLKFSKGVVSGSCPLSFWITICCIILSSSSQYWTVLPLLLSKKEKNGGKILQVVSKLGWIFFNSGHPPEPQNQRCLHLHQHFPKFLEFRHAVITYVIERHFLAFSKCVVRHIFIFKIKLGYNSLQFWNVTIHSSPWSCVETLWTVTKPRYVIHGVHPT